MYSVQYLSVLGGSGSSNPTVGWSTSAQWRNSPRPSRRMPTLCYNIPSHDARSCLHTKNNWSGSKTFHFQDEDGLLAWWRTVEGMLDIEDVLWLVIPLIVDETYKYTLAVAISFPSLRLGWVEWGQQGRWGWRVSQLLLKLSKWLVEFFLNARKQHWPITAGKTKHNGPLSLICA